MKNLSNFDEKSQSFWPSQVGRYALSLYVLSGGGISCVLLPQF